MKEKILVVGATGTVGVELVAQLLQRGQSVRVLARDPGRAAEHFGSRVEVVAGDLRDRASLANALRGIEVASLATSPTPSLHEEEGNFIAAARAASVRRLVKLSAFGIDFGADRIHRAHARSELLLRDSGIPSVVLRPVIFMSNLRFEMPSIAAGTLPSVFGDARMSFVDPRDVAELQAHALIESRYEGETWEFGGPEALTYDELAAVLTRVLGRRIEHVRVEPAAFRESALAAGFPDFVVEAITTAAEEAVEGKYATDDAVVQRILRRPASDFAAWLDRHRAAFGSQAASSPRPPS